MSTIIAGTTNMAEFDHGSFLRSSPPHPPPHPPHLCPSFLSSPIPLASSAKYRASASFSGPNLGKRVVDDRRRRLEAALNLRRHPRLPHTPELRLDCSAPPSLGFPHSYTDWSRYFSSAMAMLVTCLSQMYIVDVWKNLDKSVTRNRHNRNPPVKKRINLPTVV